MKKIFLCFSACLLFASEDVILDNYPQKQLNLSEEQKKLLNESMKQQNLLEKKRQKIEKDGRDRIKGSTHLQDLTQSQDKNAKNASNQNLTRKDNPYEGFKKSKEEQQAQEANISFQKQWIYGTAVITTTFLDGSIKRSYGVLLRDGLFVTSANMIYDKSVYARSSYAMMQDSSSLPFICIAKLSVKALDLQKGLAILETLAYTDIYCNERSKSFYHERIYSQYWVNVFNDSQDDQNPSVVYSPYITKLNSFATEKNVLQESLEQLAKKESNDFEGYKYAYGKGFYTYDGKLLGIVGASNDNVPKFIKTKEISSFLCELKERKILKNPYLQDLCPSSTKKD